jgi:hypothetical protein
MAGSREPAIFVSRAKRFLEPSAADVASIGRRKRT